MLRDAGTLLTDKGCRRKSCYLLALFAWALYTLAMVGHLQRLIEAPQTRRVIRDIRKYRLPNFYFCPADRTKTSGAPFSWSSFDCRVTYKEQSARCAGEVRPFQGDSPEDFKADGNDAGGSCLELYTHDVSIKQEWSAAWNEITMRVAFVSELKGEDLLQEVELGYRPLEWQTGPHGWKDRYYYPLLRVPAFTPDAVGTGMAVRSYLQEEVDHELQGSGKYWYTYGAVQVPVLNASRPQEALYSPLLSAVNGRTQIAHVVLTIEDFEMYGTEEVPYFFTMLGMVGQIAGFSAFLAVMCWRCCPRDLEQLGLAVSSSGIDSDDRGADEIVVYSEVATDEPDPEGQEASSRRHLLEAAE